MLYIFPCKPAYLKARYIELLSLGKFESSAIRQKREVMKMKMKMSSDFFAVVFAAALLTALFYFGARV